MQHPFRNSLLALSLALGTAATPLVAQSAFHHGHNPQRQAAMLSKKLGLSAEQKAQIEPILADRQQRMQALKSSSTADGKAMHEQRRAIMQDENAKINAVLTPAQQQQFAQLRAEHHHGRHAEDHTPAPAPTL